MRNSAANQQRMTAAVRDLESTAGMVQGALPAVKPIVWTLLGFFTGSGGGSDSGGGSGKGKGGKLGSLIDTAGGVLGFIRDSAASVLGGIAGAVIGDRLSGAAEETEGHEQDVADAEDSLEWGDEVFDSIQQECADAVESCVSSAVPMARALIAAAAVAGVPEGIQLRMMAAQLLNSAGESVCAMVEGRNESLSECMDFMVERCAPAAREDSCNSNSPLADDPAPAVTSAACAVDTLPAAVDCPTGSAAPVPAPTAPAPGAPDIMTQAASIGAGVAVAVGAGVASSGVPTAPCPPALPTLPQLPSMIDIVGNVQQTVDTVISTAFADCPEPPPADCPPAECVPVESEPSDCDTVDEEPEPEPEPVPETGFDKSGFDKYGYRPDAAVDHVAQAPQETMPEDTATGSDVGAAPSGDGSDSGDVDVQPAPKDDAPAHPGWSPDVWTTDKSAQAEGAGSPEVTVERSEQW
ncbi:MAG TPA: hypothetical protein H9870_01570 [Candidatus Corynebacterium avicola]|uniref:Uncharacterized protein n=1 Tax=Candidatus Corynebacterium avicola TaxID=2838527 RepID=A0A9D1RMQ4_9CORY|nr:hypothetical protein [Candidatus Corynebacterium avicola]